MKWAALTLAIAVTGCGAISREVVPTIRLATWFGTSEAKELAPIVARINARLGHQGRLEVLTIPDAYLTKVDTMMAGGMAPDIFLLNGEYLASYAHIQAILDLDLRIRADRSVDLADYYPTAIAASTWKGRLYSLPWVMMPVVLYYNRSLFDDAGLAYPDSGWDWSRLAEAARKLTRRDASGRVTQWGFVQHTWPPYFIWVWQNGGDFLSPDGKRPTLDDPRTVEALEFVNRIMNVDRVCPSAGSVAQLGINELFKSGRVGMFFGGASDDHDRTPGLATGVAELPKGRVRATFSWVGHLVISRQTRHPGLAYQVWRELIEGFHHWKIVAPRRSLAQQLGRIEPRKAHAQGVILASMEYARGYSGVVEQTDWDSIVLDTLLGPILRGEVSARQAAAATQAKLEKLMEMVR